MLPQPLDRQGQTVTGYPNGDCVRASYASLFRIPLEEVPRFDPGVLAGRKQTDVERRWLRQQGYDLVIVPYSDKVKALVPEDLRHLIACYSPRMPGKGHRVVGRGGKIEFDPHPSQDPITRIRAFYFVTRRL